MVELREEVERMRRRGEERGGEGGVGLEKEEEEKVKEVKKLFSLEENKCLLEHIQAAKTERGKYLGCAILMIEEGLELQTNVKAKLLCTVLHLKMWNVCWYLLQLANYSFGVPEVLRALKMLDSPRKLGQLERKLAKLVENKAKPSSQQKVGVLIGEVKEYYVEGQTTKLTSSISNFIKKEWVRKIGSSDLNFFRLHLPSQPWIELADILHLSPKDFQVEWFLPSLFNPSSIPKDSLALVGKTLHAGNVEKLASTHLIPYSFIRKQLKNLSLPLRALVSPSLPSLPFSKIN